MINLHHYQSNHWNDLIRQLINFNFSIFSHFIQLECKSIRKTVNDHFWLYSLHDYSDRTWNAPSTDFPLKIFFSSPFFLNTFESAFLAFSLLINSLLDYSPSIKSEKLVCVNDGKIFTLFQWENFLHDKDQEWWGNTMKMKSWHCSWTIDESFSLWKTFVVNH